MNRVLNVVLRFSTLITRFIFIFFLAKYLDAEKLGYYGIFTATIAFAVFLVGFEYHTYVTRQLLNSPINERGWMIKGHVEISTSIYFIALPVILVILSNSSWPDHMPFWFLPLLVLEHFNQEVFRLLIVMSRQISASILLFVRHGSWAIAVAVLMAVNEDTRTLGMVMSTWFAASLIAAVLGFWKVRQLDIKGWRAPVDRSWQRRGLMVALPLLLATLAQRGLFTIDRYWLESLGNADIVGAYVLFFGVASGLLVLLDAGVFSFAYPALIRLHHIGQHRLAFRKVLMMLYQTLVVSATFAVATWVLLPVMITWIGNPYYQRSMYMFPWILLAMTTFGISQVPHWGLFSKGYDKPILASHIVGLVVFVGVTSVAAGHFGPRAVLLSLNCAFGAILLFKTVAYIRLAEN
jgi:O-antigen/teichoic acid export membrane protein